MHQGGKSKGKGKGKDGGKGKGKDGGKGKDKNGGKGKGKDGGKGLGSYQGFVTGAACGVTQQNFASKKTPTWKNSGGCGLKVRQLLSKSHGPLIAVNTLKKASQLLRENSALHTWRELGGFELVCLLKQNRFAAIAETDGEDDDEQCVRQYQVACTEHESHMKTRDREILSVDRVKHLDLTIDFGAAEHVIGTKILPHVPVQTSEGGKRAYTTRRPMGQTW